MKGRCQCIPKRIFGMRFVHIKMKRKELKLTCKLLSMLHKIAIRGITKDTTDTTDKDENILLKIMFQK